MTISLINQNFTFCWFVYVWVSDLKLEGSRVRAHLSNIHVHETVYFSGIHSKNLVSILHLLVALVRHFRAPVRLPEFVSVSVVVVQKQGGLLHSRKITEEITSANEWVCLFKNTLSFLYYVIIIHYYYYDSCCLDPFLCPILMNTTLELSRSSFELTTSEFYQEPHIGQPWVLISASQAKSKPVVICLPSKATSSIFKHL